MMQETAKGSDEEAGEAGEPEAKAKAKVPSCLAYGS